ncbi:MAG: hypothetical protein ABII71_06140 [Candidatus Micrarchaeota archaeon]
MTTSATKDKRESKPPEANGRTSSEAPRPFKPSALMLNALGRFKDIGELGKAMTTVGEELIKAQEDIGSLRNGNANLSDRLESSGRNLDKGVERIGKLEGDVASVLEADEGVQKTIGQAQEVLAELTNVVLSINSAFGEASEVAVKRGVVAADEVADAASPSGFLKGVVVKALLKLQAGQKVTAEAVSGAIKAAERKGLVQSADGISEGGELRYLLNTVVISRLADFKRALETQTTDSNGLEVSVRDVADPANKKNVKGLLKIVPELASQASSLWDSIMGIRGKLPADNKEAASKEEVDALSEDIKRINERLDALPDMEKLSRQIGDTVEAMQLIATGLGLVPEGSGNATTESSDVEGGINE